MHTRHHYTLYQWLEYSSFHNNRGNRIIRHLNLRISLPHRYLGPDLPVTRNTEMMTRPRFGFRAFLCSNNDITTLLPRHRETNRDNRWQRFRASVIIIIPSANDATELFVLAVSVLNDTRCFPANPGVRLRRDGLARFPTSRHSRVRYKYCVYYTLQAHVFSLFPQHHAGVTDDLWYTVIE